MNSMGLLHFDEPSQSETKKKRKENDCEKSLPFIHNEENKQQKKI